jgi:hypothetical protein
VIPAWPSCRKVRPNYGSVRRWIPSRSAARAASSTQRARSALSQRARSASTLSGSNSRRDRFVSRCHMSRATRLTAASTVPTSRTWIAHAALQPLTLLAASIRRKRHATRSALGPHGVGNRRSRAGTSGHRRYARIPGHRASMPRTSMSRAARRRVRAPPPAPQLHRHRPAPNRNRPRPWRKAPPSAAEAAGAAAPAESL